MNYSEHMHYSMKHRFKKIAKRAMEYKTHHECDELCRYVGVNSLRRGLMAAYHAQMMVGSTMCGEEKRCEDVMKEQTCTHDMEQHWEQHFKLRKKYVKSEVRHFMHDMWMTYGEQMKMCTEYAKEMVENAFKEAMHPDMTRKHKMIAKIVSHCMFNWYNEKNNKTACQEMVKQYAHGMLTCCSQKCLKKAISYVETALMLHGIKDQDALYVGSRWGSRVCTMHFNKEMWTEEKCGELIKKWVAENSQLLMDTINAAKEHVKEFKETTRGESMKHYAVTRFAQWYLQFNHTTGKFNPEDFKTFWNGAVGKIKHLIEDCRKRLEEACKKVCAVTGTKCEGTEYKYMMMTMLEIAMPHGYMPHAMMFKQRKHMKHMKHQEKKQHTYPMHETSEMTHMMSPQKMHHMKMPEMMMPQMMMPPMMPGIMMPEMMGQRMMGQHEMTMPHMMMPQMMHQMMPGMMPHMMPGMMPQMMPGMMMMPEMMTPQMMRDMVHEMIHSHDIQPQSQHYEHEHHEQEHHEHEHEHTEHKMKKETH